MGRLDQVGADVAESSWLASGLEGQTVLDEPGAEMATVSPDWRSMTSVAGGA